MNHTQAESATSLRSQPTTTPKPQQGLGKDGEMSSDRRQFGTDGSDGELLAAADW